MIGVRPFHMLRAAAPSWIRQELALTEPRFLAAMQWLRGERIGAMVVVGKSPASSFITGRVAYFGLDPRPVYHCDLGDLYARREP